MENITESLNKLLIKSDDNEHMPSFITPEVEVDTKPKSKYTEARKRANAKYREKNKERWNEYQRVYFNEKVYPKKREQLLEKKRDQIIDQFYPHLRVEEV